MRQPTRPGSIRWPIGAPIDPRRDVDQRGRGDYAGKPRPVVIIQHAISKTLNSVTICGFTRDPTDLPLFRILIEPSEKNGLEFPSRIMVDKI